MKKLGLSGCIFLLFITPSVSEIGYGIKGGGELYHLWDYDFNYSSPKLGFMGGVFFKIKFLEILAIQPEILYVAKGGKYSEDESGTITSAFGADSNGMKVIPLTVSRITEFSNIEVPILFKLYAPGFITASPHLLIGPFYGYMLDERKISYSIAGVDGSTPVSIGQLAIQAEIDAFEKNYGSKGVDNKHEFGLVIGGGVDFSLGTFDLRYSIGLTGIEKTAETDHKLDPSQTGTLTIMVGFEI